MLNVGKQISLNALRVLGWNISKVKNSNYILAYLSEKGILVVGESIQESGATIKAVNYSGDDDSTYQIERAVELPNCNTIIVPITKPNKLGNIEIIDLNGLSISKYTGGAVYSDNLMIEAVVEPKNYADQTLIYKCDSNLITPVSEIGNERLYIYESIIPFKDIIILIKYINDSSNLKCKCIIDWNLNVLSFDAKVTTYPYAGSALETHAKKYLVGKIFERDELNNFWGSWRSNY